MPEVVGSSLFAAGGSYFGDESANTVTLVYESWSDEIVVDGFSGTYGLGCATVAPNDPVVISIWNSASTTDTGPQTSWGGNVPRP